MRLDPDSPPRWIYVYEVTGSSMSTVAVGDTLVDRRRNLQYVWEFLSTDRGTTTQIVGERRERLCSQCYANGKWARPYGHEGEHGEQAPRLERELLAQVPQAVAPN